MDMLKKVGLLAASLMTALPAMAQDAAPVMDKGDVSWMMTSTVLVLFMTIPGLALFYGGLVRSKNMLSVLMQTTLIACLVMVIWVVYGYSVTFGGGTSPYWGGFGKLFLAGVIAAKVIRAFAERVKFTAVLLFSALWVTLVYFPVAHMVWDVSGLIFVMGAK